MRGQVEDDDNPRWYRCHRTHNCVHQSGHGGGCVTVTEIQVSPAALYAYAIQAGLDAIDEIRDARS